ncbi:MAG: Uma2 family endonuclease [Thermomicrobiales bacterium]
MSILTQPLTYKDLEQFPDDGKRYEIIDGELYVAAAPAKSHQRLSRRLLRAIDGAAEASGSGEVFYAPVDVRFSETSQVQPDILFIRREQSAIYRGNTVYGPPDLVVEILSPSNRAYDVSVKTPLYQRSGVQELLIADPDTPALRLFALREGRYVEVEPDADGRLHSHVVPGLVLDPSTLLADLHL